MDKKMRVKLLYVGVILILVLVVLYSGLQILESTVFSKNHYQLQTTSKVQIRDGVSYYPRQDITVILLMGINQTGPVVPTEYNHGGAVDMLALLVFDEQTKQCNVVSLNRDRMVYMPRLNEHGKEKGTLYAQLAYSHAFGDGMKVSCENVRKTVVNLLYGVPINYYFSLNMNAIEIINDSVGGVQVNIVDDFSAIDPTLTMGPVLLQGKHAVNFLQSRWDVGDELNLSRMERHKEYMRNFVPALKHKLEESAVFVVDVYGLVEQYIVTNCNSANAQQLAVDYGDYSIGKIYSVGGENKLGETYYEFYADEKEWDDLVISLFYAPKK